MTKLKIENIEAKHDAYTASVSWVIGDDRYHVWVQQDGPEETIYKNSVVKHGKPGHYNTRKLYRSQSAAADRMFNEVWAVVERDDLLAKAALAKDTRIARQAQLSTLRDRQSEIEQTVLNLFRNDAVDHIAPYRAEYVKVSDAILALELEA